MTDHAPPPKDNLPATQQGRAIAASKELDEMLGASIAKFKARPGAKPSRFDAVRLLSFVKADTEQVVNDRALQSVRSLIAARTDFMKAADEHDAALVKGLQDSTMDLKAATTEMRNSLADGTAEDGDGK